MVLINKHLTHTQEVKGKNVSYGLYKVFYQNYITLYDPYFESGYACIAHTDGGKVNEEIQAQMP